MHFYLLRKFKPKRFYSFLNHTIFTSKGSNIGIINLIIFFNLIFDIKIIIIFNNFEKIISW